MSALTKDPNEGLLKALLCPCCDEYMLPPIYFCENGHNVCKNCKPNQSRCPECKQPYLRGRNWTLENICKQVEYPCLYRKAGCQEAFPLLLIQEHQSDCPFSPYNCPVVLPGRKKCPWRGPLAEMKAHVQESHDKDIWEADEAMNKQISLSPTGLYNNVVFILNEIFYVQFRCDNGNFYAFVKYIGPKCNADKYRSVVTISSKEEGEFLAACFATFGYKDDNEDIIRDGKCLKLHYNVVSKLADKDKNLSTEVKIMKKEQKFES